ncbi:serine/threonine-protein kinase [Dactylosporangium sp. CA-139066]|uniref:serine/threonine-protein kinase n=1 Tax=Dactylosporangium sp. CA-139066 TaxID=3239930 RepID=UPI003D8D8B80
MNAGQLINGRYQLVERLGEGGMSVVWRAHDRVLGREVAVKVLAPRLSADADWRRRIRNEARAAARLSHPNITSVYDYGETDGDAPFVVMELLRGPNLDERLRSGPLPPAAAIRICAEVAAGLAAAHAEELVHRDVKPANVMLTPEAAKVLDFGIVGVVGVPDTGAGDQVLGTPAYLAPERLVSDDVTTASDVYAFGLLMYRCLTGRLPWDRETTTQMVMAHMTATPEPLPDLPNVPADVRELCMSCLAKDPAGRPAAVVVAAALARAAGIVPRFSVVLQEPVPGAPEPTTRLVPMAAPAAAEETIAPEVQRRRVLTGVAVLAGIAALLVTFALAGPDALPRVDAGGARPAPPATGPTTADASTAPSTPLITPSTGAPAATPVARDRDGEGEPGNGGNQGGRDVTGPSSSLATGGGVLVAACAGHKVDLLQVVPAAGAQVVDADLGVHTKARVEFNRAGQRLRYVVACTGGAPAATAA